MFPIPGARGVSSYKKRTQREELEPGLKEALVLKKFCIFSCFKVWLWDVSILELWKGALQLILHPLRNKRLYILKEFLRISTGINRCNSADLKKEGDKKDVLMGGRLIPLGLPD